MNWIEFSRTFRCITICLTIYVICGSSCSKYLDKKSDNSLAIPKTLQDFQSLLDYAVRMNFSEPILGEIAADNYYLLANDFQSLNVSYRDNYIWKNVAEWDANWVSPYTAISTSNLVLDNLEKVKNGDKLLFNSIKGSALFFRGHLHFNVVQDYAKAYDNSTASEDIGIVLKLTADINDPSKRVSLKECYLQIIEDLKNAASLLPFTTSISTRPTKAAAFAELARVYLCMSDFVQSGLYADSCLQIRDELIDYNTLDGSTKYPIASFNEETIFFATSLGAPPLKPPTCIVDSTLYQSYSNNDLRKHLFFGDNGNNTYSFRGNYAGTTNGGSSVCFTGIATDEIYLIRAECYARNNDTKRALIDINTLLRKRWLQNTFIDFDLDDSEKVLMVILNERRKELIFRNRRWSDLKRLNKVSKFAITLERKFENDTYSLPPNDLRYELLIPNSVISISGIEQNKR
ncbi:RagB/SusD family nutrient uptake outer membrane protein [Chitinophaga sp. MM2321]|uniref:RagB/SusD family nutrient uptake outer membrane protein n=1 Tax=Chitinophaga sp. MM2321 TaxID=3137178 RepID=UPI0032D5AF8A